ncbi:hypothetical protein SAMN05216466_106105 [Paraburkholderia phenazinium]|uniref:Uncharacterized protein n=1 Tax=Paraburkholderia phenazinium TaxID=60549 RepID=A0A1G7YAJ9_9BURK|nr:hypothetical protein [Paraburkholderia phenazinium]SDG93415.1 hypothetical protein SAMN05216466_106105 [Paraburkholderia phenazinium]
MRKPILALLGLASFTAGSAHAAGLQLLSTDAQHHVVVNGVPIGIPVASFAPACQGDPKAATSVCVVFDQGNDPWAVNEVYGLPPVLDGAGRLVFNRTTVTSWNGVIDGVELGFTNEVYDIAVRDSMTTAVGQPDVQDKNGVAEWHHVLPGHVIVVTPPDRYPSFAVVVDDGSP